MSGENSRVIHTGMPVVSSWSRGVATLLLLASFSSACLAFDSTNVVAELTLLTITNAVPGLESTNTPTYNLVTFPTGATMDANGVITWTPTEAQGPSTNVISAIVSNGDSSVTNNFVVEVTEVNVPPEVLPDNYVVSDASLSVAAPGVLSNDVDADLPANALTVSLLSGPTNGGFELSSDGGFVYTPNVGFRGTDAFTYEVHDGQTNSGSVTVVLTVLEPIFRITSVTAADGVATVTWNSDTGRIYRLLYKDELRASNWSPVAGDITATNSATSKADDMGHEAQRFYRVQLLTNSAPELPILPNVTVAELTLLTVANTATDLDEPPNELTYALMSPPSGATISSNGVITWTPSEAQGPATNTLTTVVTDNGGLSATNSFTVIVTEVNTAPMLPVQTNVNVAELMLLTVTNMATDVDEPANVLTYALVASPAGATISSNGVITWTPTEPQGPSTNTLTTVVTDDSGLSATNSFTVIVTEVNVAPTLPAQANVAVAELTLLTVTNTATDADEPANELTYALVASPAGATISSDGVITWTPNEAQGPATNLLTTVVTDDGGLSATNNFTVVVTELNSAPALPAQTNVTITELTSLTVTNTATDVDEPANELTYALVAPPAGVAISSNGVITWTPAEAQGPATNTITTIVTDSGGLSATNTLTVVVTEKNIPPTLAAPPNVTVAELMLLTVTNAATDLDEPANELTYALVATPAGATISSNGVITWMPTEAQGPATNLFTTIVTDNGGLSATNSFTVIVTEVNLAPTLPPRTNMIVAELALLTVTNTASDLDEPVNQLTYALVSPLAGATISSNGVITWTPSEAQGPSTNTLTTVVGDGIVSVTNSFMVTVTEVNVAPIAFNDTYATSNGTLTAVAPAILANDTDSDLPANLLTAVLVSGPTNGVLNLNSNGGFVYVPNTNFSGTDRFTYTANDGKTNSTAATVTLTITTGPAITGQPVSQTAVVGTNTSFFVAASGTAPLRYQWRRNGTNLTDGGNILGATASALTLAGVQTNDAGNYQVVITNSVGAVTSAVATLTVVLPDNCIGSPSGLVGWWPGEGNASDISGVNNGTLQGGATASVAARVGLGFTFDGTNSYVQIPDSPALRPTNFTIETWVKFSSLDSAGSAGTPAGYQFMVFKQNTRSSNFEGFFLGKLRQSGSDVFYFSVSSAGGTIAEVNSTTLVQTGLWYHVAAVRGANFLQLFVNGQLQGQTAVSFAQSYGTFPLYFGTSGQSYWDRKLKGMLDEVSLYSRPLSSNEIAAIYAADASGKCKGGFGPSIVTQPTNQNYVANGNASFAVVASGTAPLRYQWFRDGFAMVNGARISGATNSLLTITALQAGDIGNYQVVVTNSFGSITSVVASLNSGVVPANDAFAAATSISGSSGSINGNNANATKQSGEPNHAGDSGGASVWYNWTAPSASPVTIDTTLSAFDTLLAVYTGNNVNALTAVATNNNIGTNNTRSRVTFTPVAGTVYHIAVDGAGGDNGNLTLRWIQANVPLPDLAILGSAVNPRIVTETFSSSSCAVAEGLVIAGTRRIIRFDTETANQGTADLFFGNPAVNPLFVYAPCHAHYHFQNYMSYRLRNASGQLVTVGLKVGFCVLDVFRWDAGAPNNALYTCVNQGIQKGWGDLYDSTLDGQWLDITGLPDGNYTMEMEANPLGIIQELDYNNNITIVPITIGNSSSPPLNDNFANAQTLLGTSPSVSGLNLNATKQSNEPNHAGNAGGKSVWYNWTAPSTKAVTIDTVGSSFNTLLGVYTGSMVGNLSPVASNDDIIPAGNLQSRVTFNATAGTVYRIAVDGFDAASGNLVVTVNQTVANDNFSACIFIGGVLGSISGSDVGATKEANEPNHGGNAGGHSTWYCWTAPIAGTVTFDTTGSTFNTLLGVYTGNSVGALTTIASNDDIDAANTNVQSRVTFDAVGLTMYRIAVDGFNGDSGNTFLNWSFTAGGSALALSSDGKSNLSGLTPSAGQAVLSFKLLPEGMFQLAINGTPQQRYRIERSCDLATWQPLATTVADIAGQAWFTDKAARHLQTGSGEAVCSSGQILGVAVSATEARFYRAVALPASY